MINLFRTMLLLSMVAIATAAIQPLRQPVEFDVPLDGPMPPWLLGGVLLFLSVVAGTVASTGLWWLRKWGRLVGVVAIALALSGLLLIAMSPAMPLFDSSNGFFLAMGLASWASCIGWTFHPSIASRLRA